MVEIRKFKNCYLLEVSGKTSTILDVSLDQFINGTVVPLLYSLMNGNEEMTVHIGKVECTCLEGEPHKCIANIKMIKIDNTEKK